MAAMMRTSTLITSSPPTRVNSFLEDPQELDLHGQRHLAHLVEEEGAAVACLKLPSRRRRAPVNDPFSWPKSSDSSRPSDMAAQFILMKDLSLRGELKWMAPAIISLPVPDSR